MMENRQIVDIFETENDARLMDFKTKSGTPVWMIARYYLMDYVISSKIFSSVMPIRYRKSSLKAVAFLIKSLFKNLKNRKLKKRSQIVLYSTNRKTQKNGKFFNRYVDDFAQVTDGESYVIEQAMLNWDWAYPRVNEDVIFDSIARVKAEIYGKFHKRSHYEIVSELIEYYFKRVEKILDIVFTVREKTYIVKHISQLICVSEYMARWVEKQITPKTKVFIMVGAGFSFNYPINIVLKKHNVVCVELQHGYITKTSIMYNYADKILERKETAIGLPDYMITYGEWWNDQMNCPMKKVAVGNPYHDYCLANGKSGDCDTKNIVVLGAGQNTEKYLELAEYVTSRFPNFNVIFRPHPGEEAMAHRIVAEKNLKVQFDKNCEIYDTLWQANTVISEITTVLFEAVGVVKKIIVWNNDYSKAFLPEHPFDVFEKNEELDDIIYGKTDKSYNGADFWSSNSLQNYLTFINMILTEEQINS